MKNAEIQQTFENFAKAQNLKIGTPSHFEGEKYQIAKPYTVSLKYADRRCGNRLAVVLNLPNGCIAPLTSFLPLNELNAMMEGACMNLKNRINQHGN